MKPSQYRGVHIYPDTYLFEELDFFRFRFTFIGEWHQPVSVMTDLYTYFEERYPYLSEDMLASVIAMGEVQALAENEILIKAGERSHKLALVLEGMARNFTFDSKGEEVTVVFAGPMQVIAPYTTLFTQTHASEATAAVEPSVLLVFDFRALQQRALSDSMFSRLYADMIINAFVKTIQRVEDFTQRSPTERYRRILLEQPDMIDRIPLKYLASYIGVTAVSLSRIRKRVSQNRN